jgi:uncharacterized lipoprotein NlpE involved in copper resistance
MEKYMKKQTNKINWAVIATVVGVMFIITGCGNNAPSASEVGQKTGEALDTAADNTVDLTEKALDKTSKALDKAGEAVENTGENMQK